MDISGTLYSYYFLCKRKVWLYYHKISFENQNKDVMMGKEIDQNYYKTEKHNILIDGVASIDYIKNNIVYEVKKSDKQHEMGVNQLKYYLHLLKLRGVDMKGRINYPLLKKTEDVVLKEDDEGIIIKNLEDIEKIIDLAVPPEPICLNVCKSCAYYEFCFS